MTLNFQGDAKATGQVLSREYFLDGARGEDGTAAQQHRVGEPVGHLLDVVRDEHHHGRLGIRREHGKAAQQVLAPA
jgi:hypothetical protein